MSGEPIVLGVGAIVTARRVGTTAWTVLMAPAVSSEPVDGPRLAWASVRSLAADLGLTKDTVNRALARLRRAGFVVPDAAPFELGAYRVTVPPDVIPFTTGPGPDLARRRRPLTVARGIQLTLLEADLSP